MWYYWSGVNTFYSISNICIHKGRSKLRAFLAISSGKRLLGQTVFANLSFSFRFGSVAELINWIKAEMIYSIFRLRWCKKSFSTPPPPFFPPCASLTEMGMVTLENVWKTSGDKRTWSWFFCLEERPPTTQNSGFRVC